MDLLYLLCVEWAGSSMSSPAEVTRKLDEQLATCPFPQRETWGTSSGALAALDQAAGGR